MRQDRLGVGKTERVTYDTKRLASLQREIASRTYEVDSGAVAEAILLKLRLVRRARRAIAAMSDDRSPGLGGPSRPDR